MALFYCTGCRGEGWIADPDCGRALPCTINCPTCVDEARIPATDPGNRRCTCRVLVPHLGADIADSPAGAAVRAAEGRPRPEHWSNR